MSDYRIKDSTLISIADAVREKSKTTDGIAISDIAETISTLPEPDQINNAQVVTAVAEDKIQIGDTVYTIGDGVKNIEDKFHYSALSSYVQSAVLSPDGKTLVLGGWFSDFAQAYSVNGTTITYISDILY